MRIYNLLLCGSNIFFCWATARGRGKELDLFDVDIRSEARGWSIIEWNGWFVCVCISWCFRHCHTAILQVMNVLDSWMSATILCFVLYILSIFFPYEWLPFDVFDMDRFLASLVHHEIDKDFCMNKFAISWNDHQHWTEHIFFFIIQKCCLDTFRVSLPSAHRGGNAFKQSTIRMSLRVSHSIS